MRIFISYSRQNSDSVKDLSADLGEMGHEVWFDKEIVAGQVWWNHILDKIRYCDVFVFLVSQHANVSKFCQTELQYAHDLHRSIIPVLLDEPNSFEVRPAWLNSIQRADYRKKDKHDIIAIVRAFNLLPPAQPLPDPLPRLPEIPDPLLRIKELAESRTLTQDELNQIVKLIAAELAKIQMPKELLKISEDFSNRTDLKPSTKGTVISLMWNWVNKAVHEIRTTPTSNEKQDFVVDELEYLLRLDESRSRELILQLIESAYINPDIHRRVDLLVGVRLGVWINRLNDHLDESSQRAILKTLSADMQQSEKVQVTLNLVFQLMNRDDCIVREQCSRLLEENIAGIIELPSLSTTFSTFVVDKIYDTWTVLPYGLRVRATIQQLLKRSDTPESERLRINELLLSQISTWQNLPFLEGFGGSESAYIIKLLLQTKESPQVVDTLLALQQRNDLESQYKIDLQHEFDTRISKWSQLTNLSESSQKYIIDDYFKALGPGGSPSLRHNDLSPLFRLMNGKDISNTIRESANSLLQANVDRWLEISSLAYEEQKWILKQLSADYQQPEKQAKTKELLLKLYKKPRLNRDVKSTIESFGIVQPTTPTIPVNKAPQLPKTPAIYSVLHTFREYCKRVLTTLNQNIPQLSFIESRKYMLLIGGVILVSCIMILFILIITLSRNIP